MRNSRSGSESSNSTASTHDESLEGNLNLIANINRSRQGAQNELDEEEEATYQPIKLPTEPTLEELLVSFDRR